MSDSNGAPRTPEEMAAFREHCLRAEQRARLALKRGDRIRVTRCGGSSPTYTLQGFDGRWIFSKSGVYDLSPFCIVAVNGVPTSFRDDPKEHLADIHGYPRKVVTP